MASNVTLYEEVRKVFANSQLRVRHCRVAPQHRGVAWACAKFQKKKNLYKIVTVDTTTIWEGGERSEGPDAQCKGTQGLFNTQNQQYIKQSKGNINLWAAPLVGRPPGRPPHW